ncbi:hypothetical protein E8E12_000474 [Didymella heteroderae]|uniref:Uncharacterized protein n=1 Tax=Didymella heteroderae TaxID=1769908 RepID=A0A9P4WFY0_9PLEO|nr:hypothetical protein E8E12_000474 [Didymella heteroderae]
MDPVSFPLDRSPFLGAATASQIPATQLAGDASGFRSEPFALRSPCPTVAYQESIADDLRRDACSVEHARPLSGKLELLDLDEWNENETYDEEPPTCLHYSIEWKVTLNNKVLSRDTEPDLVLAPRFYWSLFLRDKLEKLLQKKLPPSKRVACEDTNVVVSVTERSKRDLTKRFDEMDVDWFLVERQLTQWGESFRAGKKLRVDVTFNYVELGQPAQVASKRGGKRGYHSATQQMLAERDSQVDAEEGTSSQPSIWQDVYNLMRCPGPPCNLGPHCWRDPHGKKHYKLRTHQLKALIRHVAQGGQLQSHDDVPDDVRQQLYAEEQQKLERHQRASYRAPAGHPPIHITNVLPGSSHSMTGSAEAQAKPRLDVPGFLDAAVEEYSNWQQSRVMREDQKDDIRNTCDMALEHGLDLQQLHDDQDPDFFISRGIKLGVARRFIRDIGYWVQRRMIADGGIITTE